MAETLIENGITQTELKTWADHLKTIAKSPLEFCPEFPKIAQRYEAWWACDVTDRPVFQVSVNTRPERPINRRLDLIEDADAWMEAKLEDVRQLRLFGDALPTVRVDFGPVLLGGLMGGRLEFGADTGWTHPMIDDDWSNEPDWKLDENNVWWQRLTELLGRATAEAPGRYLLMTPDLGGSGDVLLNLRGATELCMDAVDCPERIGRAVDAIYPAWNRAFAELYRTAFTAGAGIVHWLGIWSDTPYMIPACDFNAMLGPDDFKRFCFADIRHQAETVGRGVFHLDGPDAVKHLDALLELDVLKAIQYVPGSGEPSTMKWIETFKKIQATGRAVYITCPLHEVLDICRALRPEGLLISTGGSLKEVEEVYAAFTRLY